MEVDIPQPVNNFVTYNSTNGSGAIRSPVNATVQFNSITEVKTVPRVPVEEQRPKHKARRRARLPKIDTSGGDVSNGAINSPSQQKPLSPSKLKKLSEKDRHSRTGRRGMPKKGELHVYNSCSCICVYMVMV